MKRWAEQFEQITLENLSSQLANKRSSLRLTEDLSFTTQQVLQKGWALKVPKRETRFPDKVKNYLQEKFGIGNATGHKADPVQVSIDMRCARDELARRLFAGLYSSNQRAHWKLQLQYATVWVKFTKIDDHYI